MTHVSVRRGLLYVSIAATAWGTGGAAGALLDLSGGIGPVAVSFWRFAAGAAMLLLATRLFGLGGTPGHRSPAGPSTGNGPDGHRSTRPSIGNGPDGHRSDRPSVGNGERRRSGRPRNLGAILVTGAGMAVYQTAYFAAIADSGLAVATVVTIGATPVLVAAGGRLLLGERLGAARLGSVTVALAGLVLLTLDDGSGSFSASGTWWALLSAAGYAGVTLLNRAFATEPYATATGGFVVGGLCLLPIALVQGLLPSGDPLVFWTIIVYLGAVPTALAYGLFFIGLGAVRATTASVITLVEPVGAALLGVLLLGERLTPAAVCGGCLLLGAVALLALNERGRTGVPA
ncbi:DMT family transporter [Streptosporangium longisporum]|uniref:EamA family transporter n=1 Tax=Streptosporangium longisporum TaxID=46187 RepID=A0ABP6KI24_9ACTN